MFGERECHPMSKKANPAALLPILVFLVLYLGLGLVFEYVLKIPMGFYSIPIVVIFLIALLVACCQNRALSFDEKLTLMGHGVGDKNIITMLLIFLAAGMFVGVVGRSSAESVAYFMLSIIPSKFAVAVLFVVSCFVSTAMGTSVGTITLIVPIAIPIAAASGYSLPLCIASVMGGAMFGDNLSFISDTTIAACNGQGCAMKDKFRENFHIAFPAALASLALILVLTLNADVHPAPIPAYNLIQIIPYVLVLIGGIIGINVFVVLLIGIVSGSIIALATGATGQSGILAVKALLENATAQLESIKTDLSEKVHSENVKCYRNIQDLFNEFDSKIEKMDEMEQGVGSVKGYVKCLSWFAILNFVVLIGFILYSLGVFNF